MLYYRGYHKNLVTRYVKKVLKISPSQILLLEHYILPIMNLLILLNSRTKSILYILLLTKRKKDLCLTHNSRTSMLWAFFFTKKISIQTYFKSLCILYIPRNVKVN